MAHILVEAARQPIDPVVLLEGAEEPSRAAEVVEYQTSSRDVSWNTVKMGLLLRLTAPS